MPTREGQQEKYNIHEHIKTLLEKDWEVEKIMKFLKEIDIFFLNMDIIDR